MAKYAIGAVHSVCLIIICLYAAICLPAFCTEFYRYEYEKNDVFGVIDVSETELMYVTEQLLSYMKGQRDDLNVDAVVAGRSRGFFNDKEQAHMVDVRELFRLGFSMRNAALAGLVLTLLLLWLINRDPLLTAATTNAVVIPVFIVLALLLCGLAALNFDAAFTLFHQIFFSNDLWLLDPETDLLLNMVPLPFFIDISALSACIFAAFLSMAAIASFAYKKRRGVKKT